MISITKSIWLNDTEVCSLEELSDISGLSIDELHDLISMGIIEPVSTKPANFHMEYIVIARKARRLRDDFELDRQGLAVALQLLRQIHALENELNKLKN
jgi:chaperone modulatory protein CbpM